MKTEGHVRQKIKQVIFRHRKEYVRQGLARRPENCAHNRVVRLPVHTGNRATIRVCAYTSKEETNDFVCDSTMAGDEQAEQCPFFECRHTASTLKSGFRAKLGLDGSPVKIGVIASEYPDVAALMWVLGPDKDANTKAPEEKPENILAFFGDGEEEEPASLPERPLVEEDNVEEDDGDE